MLGNPRPQLVERLLWRSFRGQDGSRSHTVDANLGRQLESQAARQRGQSALAHAVGRVVFPGDEHASDVQHVDDVALAALHHPATHLLAEEKWGAGIQLPVRLQLLGGGGEKRRALEHRRVVHQGADRPHLILHPLHQRLDVLRAGEVGGEFMALFSKAPDQLQGRIGPLGGAVEMHRDVGTRPRQALGDRSAQPGAASGDEGDSALERPVGFQRPR